MSVPTSIRIPQYSRSRGIIYFGIGDKCIIYKDNVLGLCITQDNESSINSYKMGMGSGYWLYYDLMMLSLSYTSSPTFHVLEETRDLLLEKGLIRETLDTNHIKLYFPYGFLWFYKIESKFVSPEIWIERLDTGELKIIQSEKPENENILNTLKLADPFTAVSITPGYIYGASVMRIRRRTAKLGSKLSLLAWCTRDNNFTYLLPEENSEIEESAIFFDNGVNYSSLKVGEKERLEICLDYVSKKEKICQEPLIV